MHARYQSGFAKPLINQLLAILECDQQAALDLVNAGRPSGRALPPFKAFHKEAAPIQNWPVLVLIAPETTFDLNSDPNLRTESVRCICAPAITGSDPEWLADDATGYLRTVDIALSSAPLTVKYFNLARSDSFSVISMESASPVITTATSSALISSSFWDSTTVVAPQWLRQRPGCRRSARRPS